MRPSGRGTILGDIHEMSAAMAVLVNGTVDGKKLLGLLERLARIRCCTAPCAKPRAWGGDKWLKRTQPMPEILFWMHNFIAH
jgi:hypothetical protein